MHPLRFRRISVFALIVVAFETVTFGFSTIGFHPDLLRHQAGTAIWSTPQRQPRRNLQKRRRKRQRKHQESIAVESESPWDTADIRPLISSSAKELGEDFWMDPEEQRLENEREAARKARDPGQIPNEKLWTEILSPYKQNWIGLISVSIICIAFIFKNFPQVIDPPIISDIPLNL